MPASGVVEQSSVGTVNVPATPVKIEVEEGSTYPDQFVLVAYGAGGGGAGGDVAVTTGGGGGGVIVTTGRGGDGAAASVTFTILRVTAPDPTALTSKLRCSGAL
jgi:hypothetical protein